MVKLTYRREQSTLNAGYDGYLLESITSSAHGTVQFCFTDIQRGTLILEDKKYKIIRGCATAELDEISEGMHFPRVAIGCELILASAFMKEGTEIKRAPLDEGAYEKLRLAFTLLETEVSALRAEVQSLREQILGKPLLKFNQT